MTSVSPLSSSFRDPSGFVFPHEGVIYRQVNQGFAEAFDRFTMPGGLYEKLVEKGYLVAHEDVTDSGVSGGNGCYRVLKPAQIPYISYPYEWTFSQLKDAAMLTLRIQTLALQFGFMLKDASAYNVQFVNSKPVFIDTLSFEFYKEGTPWVAYRQFCQHFLAPLALMAKVDIGLGKLLVTHIDGIPLALASRLLPFRSRFNYGLQAHIHVHARMQSDYADAAGEQEGASSEAAQKAKKANLSGKGLQAIIESLAGTIRKLAWQLPKTEWGDYYEHTNYSDDSAQRKRELVDSFLTSAGENLRVVHDLGANTGEFSRIATKHANLVVSQDIDPVAVERNYLQSKKSEPHNILPLLQDLFVPSPAIGWANEERDSFRQRASCDVLMALALVHHLAISNNLPLDRIAKLFAELADWVIIEFVPKSDSQVIRLLQTREDIFPHYTEEGLEQACSGLFSIERKENVAGSERTLYLLRKRDHSA
jgi:ribosomal protein L11 methylase PrmA